MDHNEGTRWEYVLADIDIDAIVSWGTDLSILFIREKYCNERFVVKVLIKETVTKSVSIHRYLLIYPLII